MSELESKFHHVCFFKRLLERHLFASVIGDFITAEPGLDDKDGNLVDFLNRFRKKMHF